MSIRPWFAVILICLLFAAPANAAGADDAASASTPTKQALHRADFRIEGASCVQCLKRIAMTFRKDPGVKKADVSVFRPYWAIVIYDANQTNFKNLTGSICKVEKVRLAELEDKAIDAIPAIIIPKGVGAAPEIKERKVKAPTPAKPVAH